MCVTGCATGSMCATGWPKCPSTQTNHPCHGTPNHNVTILPLHVHCTMYNLLNVQYCQAILQCRHPSQPPAMAHTTSSSAPLLLTRTVYTGHTVYSVYTVYCTVAKVEMAPRCVMSKNLCHWPTLPSLNIDHPKDDRDVNDVRGQEAK